MDRVVRRQEIDYIGGERLSKDKLCSLVWHCGGKSGPLKILHDAFSLSAVGLSLAERKYKYEFGSPRQIQCIPLIFLFLSYLLLEEDRREK